MKRFGFFTIFITFSLVNVASAGEFVVLANKSNSLPPKFDQKIANAGGRVVARLTQIGAAIVESDAIGFAHKASEITGVRSVTTDVQIQLERPRAEGFVSLDAVSPPITGDDDVFFDLQWGHDAIDAPEAWELGYRGAGVRIAILDTGTDPAHLDLAPNLNVALSTSFISGETFDSPGPWRIHGTHVMGTVGAADNAFGIIGVAPEAELVAVKVLSSISGAGSFGGVIQGLVYAADIDADLINMSLGVNGGVPRACTFPANGCQQIITAVQRAINYARQSGTTVVVSAGNDARDLDHDGPVLTFPGELAGAIAVSATTPRGWAVDPLTFLDFPASYTNYGQSVIHVAAPGGDWIFFFDPKGSESCAVAGITKPCFFFDSIYSTIPGGWGWLSGTSMAAPHVTGVAALIIGANGGDMSPPQVEAALRRGADDLGKNGKDDFYGSGRINAYGSLK